jgi:hypothetical protein
MVTTYRILAGICGGIAGLSFTFHYKNTGINFAIFGLLSLFIALYLNYVRNKQVPQVKPTEKVTHEGHEFIYHAGFYWKIYLKDKYKYDVHKQPYCPQHQKELGNLSDNPSHQDLFCQECGAEESELLSRGRHYQLLDEVRAIAEKRYGVSSKINPVPNATPKPTTNSTDAKHDLHNKPLGKVAIGTIIVVISAVVIWVINHYLSMNI